MSEAVLSRPRGDPVKPVCPTCCQSDGGGIASNRYSRNGLPTSSVTVIAWGSVL